MKQPEEVEYTSIQLTEVSEAITGLHARNPKVGALLRDMFTNFCRGKVCREVNALNPPKRMQPDEAVWQEGTPGSNRNVYARSEDGREEAAYYTGAAWYQAKAGGSLLPFAVKDWREMIFV
jgi:hypothetical protein